MLCSEKYLAFLNMYLPRLEDEDISTEIVRVSQGTTSG